MEIHIVSRLQFPTLISDNCICEFSQLHVSVLKHTMLNTGANHHTY